MANSVNDTKRLTVTVQIGNTDNKLTQQEWNKFVLLVTDDINACGGMVHFFGGPAGWSPYQNVAWVFVGGNIDELSYKLVERCRQFKQDSIALTVGETQFISHLPV